MAITELVSPGDLGPEATLWAARVYGISTAIIIILLIVRLSRRAHGWPPEPAAA